ncbi:MAG: DUF1223 domain-containing protein [Planctomycetota bacterium]
MQIIKRFAATVLLAATATATHGSSDHQSGFAVVELFTSEGCSSCPPAERLAGELIDAYSDQPVYVVVYHVDYWDRLGWPDRFASEAHSDRQRAYAAAWGDRRIYTPQMVVNGSRAASFVGSDRARAHRSIDRAVGAGSETTVEVSADEIKPGDSMKVRAKFDARPGSEHERLIATFVVVEDDLSTDVRRGENAGRRLDHAGVVRAARTVPISSGVGRSVDLAIPADVDPDHARVIVYVQRGSDRIVLAAGSSG